MLLKNRKAKVSERGIYLQDKELQNTIFQPGQHYKYVVDIKNRKIMILSSDNTKDNTVSRRSLKNGFKPVIDIRSQEALATFKDCDYLQVQIYDDQIVVEGFVQENPNILSKVKNKLHKVFKRTSQVVDITDVLQVKKKKSIVLSKKDLDIAVGQVGYSQLAFDFSFEDSLPNVSKVLDLQEKIKNIKIPLQVASLFSGAGVMDVGFIQAGFDIIFALEMDEEAVQTYRHNIGYHIVQADILKYNKSKIAKAPIMIGGSPCQGLSNSNRYTNYLDNPNNILIKEFIEAVRANENTQVFVLENVPQILSAGEGKFKEEICQSLSDFEITSGVMSSAEFGCSQDRKRAIFIGSKIGKIDLPDPEYQEQNFKTVRDAFQEIHDGLPNQKDISIPKEITIKRMECVPPGGNVWDIPEEIRPKGQHSDMYKRLEWDKPSVTIVNPRKSMLLHPEENRILSVRECARLFGLPDDFVFKGSLSSKQQQISNAVPVPLAYSVARVIKNAILKFNMMFRLQPIPL